MSGEPSEGDDLLGRVLAERYRLEAAIGEGGIGRVYRAKHLALGSSVAVKVLLAQYSEREVLRKRFEREAAALAELSHPNVVRVADFGVQDGMPFRTRPTRARG
ncbi:MAG: protein kinase [Sandaracinaceae bacterium]